jgi:glycogen(starch) synthase
VRLALVAREFYPFTGGGIAPDVAAAAVQLAGLGEVTVFTSGSHHKEYRRLVAENDPRLPTKGVRLVFVDEPDSDGWGAFFSHMHAWSARVDQALRESYPHHGPDLIEFCDYLGEGVVTTQARHSEDPWLDRTRVCVRLHTTSYITSLLDGHLPDDFATRAVFEAERYVLRHVDTVLWSGGDVLGTYERVYGEHAIAPAVRIPNGFLGEGSPAPDRSGAPSDREPLRLLYLGRLERRKGVQNLVRAITGLERDDVQLTLLGGDTGTAPLGGSMRGQLELMAAGDPRIHFAEGLPRSEIRRVIAQHHVVVIPSLWECWPNVGREALMRNRPLLATPVGGLLAMVQPGHSGWLTRDRSESALREAVGELAAQPALVAELIESGGPLTVFKKLADPDALVERYRRLLKQRPARRSMAARPPLVSIVIPYFKLEHHVEETLASARAQTHPAVEVVVVNDGSLREEDGECYELAERYGASVVTQTNSGLGAARNIGVAVSRGRYVLPLDADDTIAPEFVERCVRALECDPELAYVTSWVRYVDPDGRPVSDDDGGYTPFGNWSTLIRTNNVGGTCTAVIRRSLFERGFGYSTDLTSYEDWLLYLELHEAGHHGTVIPERLIDYRVREESMTRTVGAPRLRRIYEELRAHQLELQTLWSPWEEDIGPSRTAVDPRRRGRGGWPTRRGTAVLPGTTPSRGTPTETE